MPPAETVHNFGKNVSFTPETFAEPKNEAELLQLLEQHRGKTIRAVGTKHAWSDAIVSDDLLISLTAFNHVRTNEERGTVTVGAGCRVKHLIEKLKPSGLTVHSLGLIDEQTVAGATATGTHGSGKHSMSHYVRRVRLAHYDPETDKPIISEIDSGPELQAARCSLGLMGVIVELELETRPVYQVQEHSQKHDSLDSMLEAEKQFPLQHFFLMPWSWHLFGQHRKETDQPKSATAGLYGVYWHLGIDWGLHLIVTFLVKVLRFRAAIRFFFRFVLPLTIVRNWKVSNDSHAILTMEHELFRHIEIEVFVTRSKLKNALEHVKRTINVFGGMSPTAGMTAGMTAETSQSLPKVPNENKGSYCHHYPICIRRVLPDDTLISTSSPDDGEQENNEDWYAISLISYDRPHQRAGFFAFAKYLANSMASQFGARCHWGKHNPLDQATNQSLYPQLQKFCQIVNRFDPHGRFSNRWLKDVLPTDVSP